MKYCYINEVIDSTASNLTDPHCWTRDRRNFPAANLQVKYR